MNQIAAKTDWKNRPKKLRCYRLKVESVEPAQKYEGRWVVKGMIGEEQKPVILWMSWKQMTSIQRNMDADPLYCVVDVADEPKIRFVWASSDKAWLENAFMRDEKASTQPTRQGPVTDDVPVDFAPTKKIDMGMWNDPESSELPF